MYSYERIPGSRPIKPEKDLLKSMITKQFALKLKNLGYRFKGKYRVYKEEAEVENPYKDIFSIYRGFEFRILLLNEDIYLCIDPKIIFKFNSSIKQLIEKGANPNSLKDFSVSYSAEREGIDGYLIETASIGEDFVCKIKNYRDFREVEISADKVFPEPRPELIQKLLNEIGVQYDVIGLQRKLSFLDSKTASRDRLYKTLEIIKRLKSEVFPLKFGEFEVNIEETPVVVR